MNKKKIVVAVVVVCIVAAGVYFGVNKFKEQEARNKVKEEYNLTDDEMKDLTDENIEKLAKDNTEIKTEDIEKPSEGSAKASDISGFNYDESKKVGGLKLPYKVSGTDLVIENIGQYTGPFVEDGSDTPKANVMSLLVTNTSKNVVQYGEIKIKINGEDTAVFKVTNLPAGTSTLVMESTGNVKFNEDDKYKCLDSIQADIDKMYLNGDKIKIVKKEDGTIGIKNISDKDFDTVYVYYKYFQKGGAYLGGITYRVKFENVKAGQTVEEKTSHYSKDFSDILMVDAY